MGWFSGARRGPRLGGDAIVSHIANSTGSTDPYAFSYSNNGDELEVRAYFVEAPIPHVLYCTYGLSPVASSQKVAGTQTELTLRTPDAPFPEQWPADHLARMARTIRRTGRDIEPGHHLATPHWSVPAYVFVADPVLGIVDSPTGRVRFTYAVGLVEDDYERALDWDPVKFAGVLGDYIPLGLTVPGRAPLCSNAEARGRVEDATAAEGSSISAVLATYLDVDPDGHVHMDPAAAEALLRGARHRLTHGASFALVRDNMFVLLDPEGETQFKLDQAVLRASSALTHELLAVFDAAPGTYRFRSAPLTITVIDPQR